VFNLLTRQFTWVLQPEHYSRDTLMREVESGGGWTRLVRGEYLEIPGLQLTQRQAQRLWGLDEQACESILQTLIDEGFLRRTPEGRYVRTDTGRPSVP
jgi:hypothetical protein